MYENQRQEFRQESSDSSASFREEVHHSAVAEVRLVSLVFFYSTNVVSIWVHFKVYCEGELSWIIYLIIWTWILVKARVHCISDVPRSPGQAGRGAARRPALLWRDRGSDGLVSCPSNPCNVVKLWSATLYDWCEANYYLFVWQKGNSQIYR